MQQRLLLGRFVEIARLPPEHDVAHETRRRRRCAAQLAYASGSSVSQPRPGPPPGPSTTPGKSCGSDARRNRAKLKLPRSRFLKMMLEIRNPEMTKNMSTPTNPPGARRASAHGTRSPPEPRRRGDRRCRDDRLGACSRSCRHERILDTGGQQRRERRERRGRQGASADAKCDDDGQRRSGLERDDGGLPANAVARRDPAVFDRQRRDRALRSTICSQASAAGAAQPDARRDPARRAQPDPDGSARPARDDPRPVNRIAHQHVRPSFTSSTSRVTATGGSRRAYPSCAPRK